MPFSNQILHDHIPPTKKSAYITGGFAFLTLEVVAKLKNLEKLLNEWKAGFAQALMNNKYLQKSYKI